MEDGLVLVEQTIHHELGRKWETYREQRNKVFIFESLHILEEVLEDDPIEAINVTQSLEAA